MNAKKNLCAMIPADLHAKVIAEKEQLALSTLGEYVELVLKEHFEGGKTIMAATKTLAFQISEELDQRLKNFIAAEKKRGRKISQKEFVISLIEQALAEADEEFEAAEAAAAEDLADGVEDMDQEDEVTSDVESDEDAEPDDAPEGDAEADAALADCAGADAGYDDPAFGADAERAV